MQKILLCAIASACCLSTAHADTIYGLYADANYWHSKADDQIQQHADATQKHHYGNQGQLMLSASVEHPVPVLPNVRLRYTDLQSKSISNADNTRLKIDANSTDLIAYYEVLDTIVSLDLGLGAKRISGHSLANDRQYLDLGTTLPMAYASAGVKLPFTGLSAKAELGLARSHKNQATDAQAEIQYKFIDKALIDVGAKIGYRILDVDYNKVIYPAFANDERYPYKVNFKGPYAGVEIHF